MGVRVPPASTGNRKGEEPRVERRYSSRQTESEGIKAYENMAHWAQSGAISCYWGVLYWFEYLGNHEGRNGATRCEPSALMDNDGHPLSSVAA